MKKIFLLLFVIFGITLCFGFANPDTLIQDNELSFNKVKQVQELADQKEYVKALEILETLDKQSYRYNNYLKNNVLKKFYEEYSVLIKTDMDNNNFTEAMTKISMLKKYYPHDNKLSRLTRQCLNKMQENNLEKYDGPIEHVFTHCLLADPSVALSSKNPMAGDYNTDCITPNEFKRILEQLYKNDYILIDATSIFTEIDGVIKKTELYLPKGKKPLIFSFDDVNYDQKKMHKGMVDKIVLDNNNRIATYTSKANKGKKISYDNEFIVIMENFISNHPDFSFNGARGLICVTGYDGVLGYRTQEGSITREQEIAKARPVINRLKELGWRFASHSYGHYHMKKISLEKFKTEVQKWKNEVEPLVGETAVYVYPYGEWEVCDYNGNICEKHKVLEDAGFKLFCGVGIRNFFSYLPQAKQRKVLFMDRTAIDGFTLRNKKSELSRLFDCNTVYDYTYRPTK